MNDNNLSIYDLFRNFWDWSFENPDLITPTHCAVFSFAIEHCNRLGWKEKFGFPSQMAMEAIGIKSWRAYSKCFNDLVDWGFFIVHQKSTNQYSANVIAIAKKTKAQAKALDKALQKHRQKHRQKQSEYNNTTIQIYNSTNIPPADEPPATPPKFNFKQNLIKLGANEQHVADLMAARSKKHLANTETALKLFISQAGKLNMTIPEAVEYCAGRSWGGLRVEYVQKETPTNTFTGQDEADMIEHIKNLSEFDWSVAKSKLVFDETNSLFHPGKQKYISYDTLTKCDRLMKYTTDIFRAKSLTLTPATYGKRSK